LHLVQTPSSLNMVYHVLFWTSPLALGPYQTTNLLTLSRHNVLALRERLPQVGEEVGPLLNVLVAKQGCDGPGSFLTVVERDTATTMLVGSKIEKFDENDLREDVVDNVVLNDAVEDVAADEAEFTVNS
jgi:hypothetical protein